MPVTTGTRIGPYEVTGWLGAGAMGEVYRARDPRLGREVAIKLIPEVYATDSNRVYRFEQEARAAGQINHPNIVAVYDIGTFGGAPYIVSELLEGESLRSRLQRGAMPPRKVVEYARQIAEGLAAAHDKRIVHRDLKPENLFITNDGRVKILDFGIAKLTGASDDSGGHTVSTATEPGVVVGTAAYMSPEQVRGEDVDSRSDIFTFGAILHEMLTGRAAFSRTTGAETVAAILKEDPPEPATPDVPALARIASRCLEKAREARFQSARDLAFGLDFLSDTGATAAAPGPPRRWRAAAGTAVVVLSVLTAAASWLMRDGGAPPAAENPLTTARFTPLTDWTGTEMSAEISPDGKFVAFLSDRAGRLDLWLRQVGTGAFQNLTANLGPIGSQRAPSNIVRTFGFSADGQEIWFSPGTDLAGPKMILPLIGGAPRFFLGDGDAAPAWSPDGSRVVYFHVGKGDDVFVADRAGGNARRIVEAGDPGMHNHNPVWSLDGQWIYFVRGTDPISEFDMNVYRIRPSGESLEPLTRQRAAVSFLTPIDARTLLYVARAEDRSGPWLWALDVERKIARRVTTGLDHYTSVAASRDGRRLVVTTANPTASLWSVPLLDRRAEERDVRPYAIPGSTRSLAPRFRGTSLFYLSSRGGNDGLWRFEGGQAVEVSNGDDRPLSEPAAVSPDGRRVAIVTTQDGTRRLVVMSTDGTRPELLAPSVEIKGAVGQGTADWSPDGRWIVASGTDAKGPALFKIPVDGGAPIRLAEGQVFNPVWSPDGTLILYSGPFATGHAPLHGVRPDGTAAPLPAMNVRQGAYRFLPDSSGVVYQPIQAAPDFWLLDLRTLQSRQITTLGNQGKLRTFDITPDGKSLVFDRSRDNSRIVVIDLAPAPR